MDLRQLQDRLSADLPHLTFDQFRELAVFAKVRGDEVTKKHVLIHRISEEIDDVIEKEEEEAARHFIVSVVEWIKEMKGQGAREAVMSLRSDEDELEKLKKQYADLQLSFQNSTKALESEIMRLSDQVRIKENRAFPAISREAQPQLSRVPEVTIRRDFKISGQIGERGQKDRLSYTNLMHQIESGVQKGHTETEIVDAVVRAISPGLSLRDMLEIKSHLTLLQLKTILKGHFKEDSPTDLYHKLVNITQDSRESPQNFLFRAIELKERLLIASRDGEAEEQYSAELIQKKFLRSVSTGLISDHNKFQLKTDLENQSITDEELIEKFNEAAGIESERIQKQKKNTYAKVPKVNELQADVQVLQRLGEAADGQKLTEGATARGKEPRVQSYTSKREAELFELVKQLKEEITEIKNSIRESQPSFCHGRPPSKKICKSCQDSGNSEQCNHCFKCGQPGHFSKGCRAPRHTVNVDQVMAVDSTALHTQSQRQCGLGSNTSELLCNNISHLVQPENVQQHSASADRLEGSIYAAHLSPKRKAQLLNLIGKKCTVNCFLDGVPTQVLWDTGSQVCLINEKWRKKYLPHTKVRDTEEILGPGTLAGKAVNQTDIPFSGWIEVKFQLEPSGVSSTEFLVPLLVAKTSGVAEDPIIGYNVIEHLLHQEKEQPTQAIVKTLTAAFSVDCKRAEGLMRLVQQGDSDFSEGTVKGSRQRTKILPVQSPDWPEGLTVTENVVKLQKGTRSKIFIPVSNDTCHDITLRPRTVLGHVQSVKAVYPAAAKPVDFEEVMSHRKETLGVECCTR